MSCSTCEYFKPSKIVETALEKIEREDKPLPIGLIQTIHSIFKPSLYRGYRDNIDELLDSIILDNRRKGFCSRFPEETIVHKNYKCGEYVKKT
jgi:hypothetical protein